MQKQLSSTSASTLQWSKLDIQQQITDKNNHLGPILANSKYRSCVPELFFYMKCFIAFNIIIWLYKVLL